MSITQRKKDHVALTASGQSAYQKTTGFENYEFIHNALPEVDFDEIETEVRFLNHSFSFPLFISSMTGGYTDAGAVNEIIARFCEQYNIPFGVGSQRIMLDDAEARESFSVVREHAPSAFIASNIGGAQLIGNLSDEHLALLTESIRADAVIVHLNPLQELIQAEGDRNFRGIKEGIRQLVTDVELPVIVKETGAGLSTNVILELLDCGVHAIDVAGSGGTSWSKVENQRNGDDQANPFNEWGIPTVDCLLGLQDISEEMAEVYVIASGGIRNSFDIAKSLCFGAHLAGTAQPIIKNIMDGGYEQLEQWYINLEKEFKMILCLLGCEKPADLALRHVRKVKS